MRLTRRDFLKIAGTAPPGLIAMSMLPLSPPTEPLAANISISVPSSIRRNESYSIKTFQEKTQGEDDNIWLPTGWKKIGEPGEMLRLSEIVNAGIPIINPQKEIQLPAKNALQVFTGSRYLDSVYPSLGKFYNEDETQISELSAYSYTKKDVPQSKSVKIIYAIAPDTDTTGYVALTPWRTTGNQVEYAIVIRLNPPVSKPFARIEDFYHWIQAVYAHEKVHIKQMEQRHQELMLANPNASKSDIDNKLRDNLIEDEAQAYWAQLTYGSIRNPEWLNEDASPYGEDLRVPFKILKNKNIDPLNNGYKNDVQNKYEALWQYVIYAHTPSTYNNLVYQSRTNHPEYIPMMEQCFKEGLITENRFIEYLKAVDENRFNQYQAQKQIETYVRNTSSDLPKIGEAICSPIGLGITGIVSLAAWKMYLMSRK